MPNSKTYQEYADALMRRHSKTRVRTYQDCADSLKRKHLKTRPQKGPDGDQGESVN